MFMRYREFMFVLLLVAAMIMGCEEQYVSEVYQGGPVDGNEAGLASISEPLCEQKIETAGITEPDAVLTLRQALALALMNNPELKVFSLETRAAQARELQAGLRPNPELKIGFMEVGGTGERSGFDSAETSIQLGQLIELAGKPAKRKKVASLERELAGWDYEAKRLNVLTDVAHAFVAVLAAQDRLKLAEELVQLSEGILDTVTKRVEAGKDSPVEQTKAQVALASARIEQRQSSQRLGSARKRLAATWASSSPGFERATGRLNVTFAIPPEAELRGMLAQNPDLARWAVEVQRRRAELELEKAGAITDPRISGGVQHFNGDDDIAVVFSLAIPIPTSNRNQGKILAAKRNLAKWQTQRRAVEADLYVALADAYEALSVALIELTAIKNEVLPGAQSALDATRQGYRQGKFDYLMVLDAQRTFFQARARYIGSLAAYHMAKADVERLIGRPIENMAGSESED
jgi:cobalt-zinc-cadmium efflux system outer membrane protein